jgi:hypothetical protein
MFLRSTLFAIAALAAATLATGLAVSPAIAAAAASMPV